MPLLSWHGRDADLTRARDTPYRLLQPVAGLSHGDADSPNMLIEGDNLDALKALLPYYAGQVKCVFIDPPYNTRSAFEQYDDNLEHSQWLSMMYPRLELLRELLAEDGSLWVTLDDNEAHYFKVMCDEIFGRANFIADVAWKKRDGAPNDRKIGSTHDHLLVYGTTKFQTGRGDGAKRTLAEEAFNLMKRTEKADSQYRLYEEPFGFDERGPFRKVDSTGNAKGGRFVESLVYPVTNPFTGKQVYPRKGRCWVYNREVMEQMVADRRFFWGRDGKAGTPMRKLFKTEAKSGMTAPTIWDDVGLNQHAAREIELIFGEKAAFDTPKPEGLLNRIIDIATNPHDLVLDSFLGSGTTAAVAHKKNRRWIGVEAGEHARTHCQPRLVKVIDGEQGGISEDVDWKGGGGFRYYRLGDTVFDGNGEIRESISFEQLAAHVWFVETHTARAAGAPKAAFLGTHADTGYYLLHGNILGAHATNGANLLNRRVLRALPKYDGPKVIYAEACDLPAEILREQKITFRQTPYDIRAR